MAVGKILIIFLALAIVVVKGDLQKRDMLTHTICDPMYNNPSKVQCYCVKDIRDSITIRSAECFLSVEDVKPMDNSWELFETLKNVAQLTFTNTRGIHLPYVPTKAIIHTTTLLKLEVKYGNIETIPKYVFANSSTIQELYLRNNQIKIIEPYSFSHMKELTELNLDQNNVEEINRNVFIDLPSLEKLFFTNNKVTTIHDRAFIHLHELRELELNMNKIFSLNNEAFYGLSKLLKLDLSNNQLQVIGDNTFSPLISLESLNLDSNMIQMIDDKGFNGLSKLKTLSLAHNKLTALDNTNIFQGLHALQSLSFKGNELIELRPDVMSPILKNFYGTDSSLDVDGNNFPCDCRLDWFMALMNQTKSNNLKISLENLKCNPDSRLREAWNNMEEQDKANGQSFEESVDSEKNADYEYYDETQLNGKLFYTDLKLNLINCSGTPDDFDISEDIVIETGTKVPRPKVVTTPMKKLTPTSPKQINKMMSQVGNGVVDTKVTFLGHGLLDLAQYETTTTDEEYEFADDDMKMSKENQIEGDKMKKPDAFEGDKMKKPDAYTTSRLATVSAKPIDNGETDTPNNSIYDGMANDEAKLELKAHRSVHFNVDVTKSSARNLGCAALVATILFVRLFH